MLYRKMRFGIALALALVIEMLAQPVVVVCVIVIALALPFACGCSSRVTTFVRAVEWSPKGSLLVTTCTLEEDGFTKGNAVDPETCHTEERPHP